jgi:hypothetical protein
MTRSIPRLLGYATVSAGVAAAGYVGLVTGACPIDLGIGRRIRPLGPQLVDMAAPREVVFDVIAQPYLGRAPRALADKLRVLERGSDMVLAAHFTPLGGRLGLVAQTVETVRFTPPRAGRVPAGPRAGPPRRGGVRAHRAGRRREHSACQRWGDRRRPVAPGPALVCAGRAPLGADGGGLAGCG